MNFLDTNVILRYLTCDDPEKAKKCGKLFKKAVDNKETLCISTMVVAEIVWTLEKAYKLSRSEIADCVQKILNTPNFHVDEKDILLVAITLYELKKIDFIDAYHVVFMKNKGIEFIYSYDSHFDLVSDLKRIEP
ncbi:MAG: type II toxin-antitoxin system VapC family toxin [Candidatus Omnitrophota bacterium]